MTVWFLLRAHDCTRTRNGSNLCLTDNRLRGASVPSCSLCNGTTLAKTDDGNDRFFAA